MITQNHNKTLFSKALHGWLVALCAKDFIGWADIAYTQGQSMRCRCGAVRCGAVAADGVAACGRCRYLSVAGSAGAIISAVGRVHNAIVTSLNVVPRRSSLIVLVAMAILCTPNDARSPG